SAAALPSASTAITPVGPKPVAVALLSESQQGIVSSGAMRARIEVRQPGGVTVAGFSRGDAASSGESRVTKRVKVHFKDAGVKIVKLALNGAGPPTIGSCAAQTVAVTGRLKISGGGKGRSRSEASLN